MNSGHTIICIGTNHKKAPIALREYLFIDAEQIEKNLPKLKEEFGFSEVIVLSTCNRLEIVGLIDKPNANLAYLSKAFFTLQKHCGHEIESLADSGSFLYCHQGFDASLHVIRVASSLDSLVVGETQITGQFKDAVRSSKDLGLIGSFLDRMSQEALKTAKKVRSQTEIGKKSVSIASAAVDLITAVFAQVERYNVMIVGAGEMARVVAKNILKLDPKSLAIVNRSESRAVELIKDLGRGNYIALENLVDELERYDIIVTATAAADYLITKSDFQRHMTSGRTKLCVDISLPRNIDPESSEIEELYSFDIDDLKQIVDNNSKARNTAANQAEIIVEESAKHFIEWVKSQTLSPLLKSNGEFFTKIIESEFARSKADWKENSQDLEKIKLALIKTLSSTVNKNIQNYQKTNPGAVNIDLLAKIFDMRPKDE